MEVFLADFPRRFFFTFSVFIVDLIYGDKHLKNRSPVSIHGLIPNMPVSEDEMALTRGQIPSYMSRQIFDLMSTAMDRTSQRSCLHLFLNHLGLLSNHHRSTRHKSAAAGGYLWLTLLLLHFI
jgi:hypothetical protein